MTIQANPNGSFKFEYPELWSQFYGDQGLVEHIVKTGLDHKPIFESSTKTHCIDLYFDANTGTVGSLRLIKKVRQEARRLQVALACGRTATVEQPLRKYLEIVEENGIFSVSYKTQA